MNFTKVPLVLAAIAIISGCSVSKIDASSDETMMTSIAEVRESLPEGKRENFDQAIPVIAFSQIDMKELISKGDAATGEIVRWKIRQSLDGKTGDQVIAESERIQDKLALEEILELEEKRIKSEDARKQLKKFEIIISRFYMDKQQFGQDQPVFELTVKNGTGQAVARVYFEGTIASPGRSVPWHKDTFNYSISGGLEAGEEAAWTLAPNKYSDWGKVHAPADAVFTVTVEQLDGADGKPIYSTRDFEERDLERLTELKKKYGVE